MSLSTEVSLRRAVNLLSSKLIKETYEVHNKNRQWFSSELNNKLNDIHSRLYEPMRVAIVGQFSSGKSTFLNAILSKNIYDFYCGVIFCYRTGLYFI